jgi:hypothetical protein
VDNDVRAYPLEPWKADLSKNMVPTRNLGVVPGPVIHLLVCAMMLY